MLKLCGWARGSSRAWTGLSGLLHVYHPFQGLLLLTQHWHEHQPLRMCNRGRTTLLFTGAGPQGEGELKILDRLVRPWAAVAPRDSHAVVAGDADLVLMGLMARRPHLHILASVRSGSHYNTLSCFKCADSMLFSLEVLTSDQVKACSFG